MTTLYLHVGFSKTGTTALQKFLATNTNELFKAKILYPKAFRVGNTHHKLFWLVPPTTKIHNRVATKIVCEENFEQNASILEHEIKNTKPKTIILSSELFSNTSDLQKLKYLKKRFRHYQLKIIVYIRRQDNYLRSMYNQVVKHNHYCGDLFDFLSERTQLLENLDYNNYINKLAKVVGKESITIRIYDKTEFINNNIYDDFTHCFAGKNNLHLEKPSTEQNVRLSETAFFIKKMLNSKFTDEKSLKQIMNILVKHNEELSNIGIKNMPSQKAANKFSHLIEGYQISNQRVANKYFPDRKGLFEGQMSSKANDIVMSNAKDFIAHLPKPVLTGILALLLQ